MGGQGSGRGYRWDKKQTVEDSLKLSLGKSGIAERLNQLETGDRANGGISWSRTYDGHVTAQISYRVERLSNSAILTLRYTQTRNNNSDDISYPIKLSATTPNYGGLRWWFICPEQDCGRRVGMLYLPGGYKYFLCRHCYDLTYTSCQESHKFDRLFGQIGDSLSISMEQVKQILDQT